MAKEKKRENSGAFSGLKNLIQEAGIRLKSEDKLNVPEQPKAKPVPVKLQVSEDHEFEQAMGGIERSHWKHNRINTPFPAPNSVSQTEREEEQLMKQSIEGELAPIVQEHPEYIEGWIGVAGKKLLPNLRIGLYSIQGQLDLHGYNRIEARIAVEDFLLEMSRFRSCCVKIIHGRGINSRADRAVLKENLQQWLGTRKMSKFVLAYASAPMTDGGVGAIYVLLRQP